MYGAGASAHVYGLSSSTQRAVAITAKVSHGRRSPLQDPVRPAGMAAGRFGASRGSDRMRLPGESPARPSRADRTANGPPPRRRSATKDLVAGARLSGVMVRPRSNSRTGNFRHRGHLHRRGPPRRQPAVTAALPSPCRNLPRTASSQDLKPRTCAIVFPRFTNMCSRM